MLTREEQTLSTATSLPGNAETQTLLPENGMTGCSVGRIRAATTFGLGLWLSLMAALGLLLFHESDYFHHQGAYPRGWVGYTARTFIGLVVFVACGGCGVILILRGTQTFSLHCTERNRRVILSVATLSFISVGASGLLWGHESMKCLVVFCLDTGRYHEVPHQRPEAGLGFLSVVGMTVFFTMTPVGVVLATEACRCNCRFFCPQRSVVVVVVGLMILSAFVITTFYVPNSWEYFVASRIANNAQLTVSTNASECPNYLETTCPEIPWAWMKTAPVRVNRFLVLKLYPSNVIFFAYLFLFATLSFVVTSARVTRLFCRRVPFVRFRLNNGQIISCALTTAMLALFFLYWHHDHNYNGYWQGGRDRGITQTERWARSLGQLAVAFLSLLMFPASRFSLLHSCLGTSWESSLWAHKALGYGMLCATLGHVGAWYLFYYENGNFPHDIFAIPVETEISKDNFTIPLISLATWFLLVSTGVFSLWPLRRKAFAIFHSLHVAGFVVIIPAVLWHAAAAWEYLLPGLTLYGLDVLSRLRYSARRLEIVSVQLCGAAVRVDFRFPHSEIKHIPAGAFVFINVPEISVLEWHPFTLCVASRSESVYSIYVKRAGRAESWSRKFALLCRRPDSEPPLMICQGFAGGTAVDPEDYEHIIFVAGGIGITPCYAIMQSLCSSHQPRERDQQRRLSLLWVARDVELLHHFKPLLQELVGHRDGVSVRLFSSLGERVRRNESSHGGGLQVELGRPNVRTEIDRFLGDTEAGNNGKRALIFGCGPEKLVTVAEQEAKRHESCFHAETFLF